MTWREIWNASENSELRARRKTPDILLPGDQVVIPSRDPLSRSLATGAMHRIQIRAPKIRLRVHMRRNGRPLASMSYVLRVGAQILNGTTGQDGLIDVALPTDAETAVLELPGVPYKQKLLLGHLDPADSISGLQGRLQNLGAGSLSVTGTADDATTQALLAVQRANGLPATGDADASTMAAVEKAHGC